MKKSEKNKMILTRSRRKIIKTHQFLNWTCTMYKKKSKKKKNYIISHLKYHIDVSHCIFVSCLMHNDWIAPVFYLRKWKKILIIFPSNNRLGFLNAKQSITICIFTNTLHKKQKTNHYNLTLINYNLNRKVSFYLQKSHKKWLRMRKMLSLEMRCDENGTDSVLLCSKVFGNEFFSIIIIIIKNKNTFSITKIKKAKKIPLFTYLVKIFSKQICAINNSKTNGE